MKKTVLRGNLCDRPDTCGATVHKADYYPYGKRLYTSGDIGKYSYNGKEYVDDYGFDLYYYGVRFMDPNTGRFITPDPIKDYLNQYSYVGNNPVNRIDPTGMVGQPFVLLSSATYAGFGLDALLNEDANEYFSKALISAKQAIENAVEKAKAEANKAASDGNKDDEDYWNGVAEALQEILTNGSFVVTTALPETKGATMDYDYGQGATMYINIIYLNAEYSDYLTGFILHEGAHAAYDKGNFAEAMANANDLIPKTEKWNNYWKYYKAKAEDYAWRGTVKYFHDRPPSSKGVNKDVVETFREIESNYLRNGMDKTIEFIMKNLYYKEDLYRFWRQIK